MLTNDPDRVGQAGREAATLARQLHEPQQLAPALVVGAASALGVGE